MSRLRRIAVALGSSLLVSACAGAAKRAAKRAAPDEATQDASTTAAPADAPAPPMTPMARASDEIERAQRELDVAAGDCQNACRALGSMDRAIGKLCALGKDAEDGRRCEDAKKRLYSARDKVKATCGTCADVSVERSAPVLSR